MRFIDTSVLLYAVSRDPAEQDKARQASAIVMAALDTRHRFRLSYWDCAIIEASRAMGCAEVLSEHLADGQDYAGVRVINPFR